MTSTASNRSALLAAYAGLALTIAAMFVLFIDRATSNLIAAHIRHGYPDYSPARINSAATLYLVYLSVLGGLGVLAWLGTIWLIARRRRIARPIGTALFVAGTGVALFNLLITDTSGETGLPTLIGLAGLIPSAAGLIVVIMLWRRTTPHTTDPEGIRS